MAESFRVLVVGNQQRAETKPILCMRLVDASSDAMSKRDLAKHLEMVPSSVEKVPRSSCHPTYNGLPVINNIDKLRNQSELKPTGNF